MSSLLDHLDNNHSDDDEDDHINRLFPKCKPRASSLSLSPSLQLQPFGDDSTSTSTSDSQLPTSELTVSFSESKNRNINYRHNNNQFNHSSSRRHSSNSSNFNYEENHALLHSSKQCDRDELVAHEIVGQTFTQYYENNNFNNSSKNNIHSLGVSPSSIPLVNSKSYSGNLGKTSIPLPTNFKSRKSESNHFHNQQHQQQHQHPRNTSKASRREHSNSNNTVNNSSYHPPRHHRANNTNTSGNNRGSYETVGRIDKLKVGSTSPSFISSQSGKGKNLKGGQRDKGREKLLNLSNSSVKSPSSLSLASHSSVAGMECDTLDDHFDNGIGSGGSGSSSGGSNSHSNGSAFSENILSGSVSVGNMTAAGVGSGSLRDSRIEIAGGREIFSQNRIRAGRRLRGSSSTSSSTEMMVDPSVTSASTTPSNKTRRKSPNSNPQYQHQHHQQIPQGNSNSVVPSVAGGATVNSPGSSNSTSTSVWERNNSSVSSKKSMGLSFKGVPGSHRHHTHGRGFGGHHQQSHVKSRHGHSYGHGYDYSKSLDFDVMGGGVVKGGLMPQVHATSPSSAVTMKETVFSSEITSIEKAVAVGGTAGLKSPIIPQETKSPSQVELKAPFIYETPVGGGEIVFDDIEDWQEDTREEEAREGDYEGEAEEENDHDEDEDDHSSRERRRIRNRSPQSQLHLLEVLMKDNEGKVSGSSSGKHHHHHNAANTNMVGLLDGSPCPSNPGGNTTPSGYESDECSASASAITSSLTPTTIALKTSPNNGNKRLIGNIPIAEYEGSPKRYGLRQQSHATMPTHLDLVDVGMELNTESERNRSAHMQTAQCLQSQSTPAPTSSSSSSLDNTNTVASSNSSSRINYNRISPRVLSPSQSLSGYPPKVPGFPQRVTSAPGVSSNNDPVCMDNNTGGSLNASGTLAQEMARESADEMAKLAIGDSRNSVLTQNVDSGECSSGKLAGGVSALTSDLIIGQLNVKLGTSDLSPDDSVASQQGSNNTTSSTSSDPEHDLDRRSNIPTIDTNNENDDLTVMRRSLPLSLTTNISTGIDQDYLYEFSETRKVLEEFFKVSPHLVRGSVNASEGGELSLMSGERPANFDELDYTLRRQAGNSYVGQRLAGECAVGAVEESPKKPPRRGIVLLGGGDGGSGSGGGVSPRLISFQEVTLPPMHSLSLSMHTHSHSHLHSHSRSRSSRSPRSPTSQSRSESHSPSSQDPSRDVNDNDIDAETTSTNTETDLGETEVGLQVGHSRNFTLSPETTDCDSNELESEMSLDYEASVHSSSRVGVAMPVLEDGLSSGNVSDNDDVTGNDGSNSVDTGCAPGCSKRLANSSSTSRKLLGLSNNGGNGIPTVSSSCGGNIANTVSTNTHNNAASQSAVSGNILNTIGNASVPCSGGTTAATPSEANPTLLLMKKQISEIEKEIKLRASQQCQRLQQQATNPVGDTNGSSNGAGGINANGTTSTAPPPPTTTMSSTTIQQTLECNNTMQSANTGRGANNLLSTRVGIGDTVAVGGVNLGIAAIVEDGFSDSSSRQESSIFDSNDPELEALDPMRPTPPPSPAPGSVLHHHHPIQQVQQQHGRILNSTRGSESGNSCSSTLATNSTQASGVANGNGTVAVVGLDSSTVVSPDSSGSSAGSSSSSSVAVAAAIQDIKDAIQRTKSLPQQRQFDHPVNSSTSTTATTASAPSSSSQLRGSEPRELHQQSSSQERLPPLVRDSSPVWVPRQPTTSGNHHHHHHRSANAGVRDPLLRKQRYEETPDDDADTDQETDRLLGQNRTDDDYGFYDDKEWKKVKSRSILPSINKGVSFVKSAASATAQAPLLSTSASSLNNTAASASLNPNNPSASNHSTNSSHNNSTAIASTNNHSSSLVPTSVSSSSLHSLHSKSISPGAFKDSQLQLPSSVNNSSASSKSKKEKDGVKKKRSKEDLMNNPSVLIEGVLFRARYLGSTQLVCEGQPTKATRMMQAEEAVSRIKAQANQNGSVCQSESQVQQQNIAVSSASTTPTPTTTTTTTTEAELKSPGSSTSHMKLRKKSEESGEFEDYLYAEDEESCCEDESLDEGDGDEDFFDKARHQSPGSLSLLRDNKRMAMGLDDIGMGMSSIHGSISSSALQMHNHHSIPQSLLNNRESEIGNSPSTSTSSSTFQVNPPCATALPGTMFRLRFVGSLEVEEEIGTGKRRRKRPKKTMVEEAVMKMKSLAPEGETQPSTEVDLFISTEKIMVLNTDLKEIMMDHALRTISYIADIGDLVVLMARRRPVPTDTVDESKIPRPPKMICHVFESDEAQYIAQSIGQAFQVAYMEFLKANGIEDHSFVREMDYQEVLNSQEIFGDELQMFAKKELQKEVVVPKTKGEILGVVIVESGWGSMLPTVVIANLAPAGAAARCGQLNIGDQIIAINGVSLVGLPLSTCQNYIKNTKTQTVVKLTVVPCPPVVEVKIKRPDTKYQLGFSVQNGVICSLLRGGIAERGGVRVGHRIIEINNQSVVAVPHEKIVNLLATSVGEINMKTMPTSMFRLLTGQETPLYI